MMTAGEIATRETGWTPARARRWTATACGATLLAWLIARLAHGTLPQWASYHDFADTRVCGSIPRAGDVLSNLAILAAGLWGLSLRRRVALSADERPAFALLVTAAILTACGSAYYHWAPDNARLVWDRLPMALLLTAIIALVLADRIDQRLGREFLWPFAFLSVCSVAYWGVSEATGRGDLLLYLVVRVGAVIGVLALLVGWRSRWTATGWLWAAVACEALMTAAERLDWQIWWTSGGLVSGHNLKHVLAAGLLACLFVWLSRRRPLVGESSKVS